jgi:hypothetical protein
MIARHALKSDENRRTVAAALRGDKRYPFRIVVKSNSGGRFPAQIGFRNLRLAVKMSARLEEMQKRGDREPYRAAAQQVADECGIGSSTVEAAYEKNRIAAQGMLQWAADLRDAREKFQKSRNDPTQGISQWAADLLERARSSKNRGTTQQKNSS